jgi:UDP:flavonoid glycosyltransferase YjiC (YdhE family)
MVTLGGFDELVRGNGLDHLPIGDSPRDIASTAAGRSWTENRTSTLGFLRGFVRLARALIETGIANYWRASRDAEALIVTTMGLPVGAHIAERLNVPLICVSYAPTHSDWAGREDVMTALRGDVMAVIVAAFRFLLWNRIRRVTNAARRQVLDLPPLSFGDPFSAMHRKRIPLLEAYSPTVVPRPPSWGSWIHVTGFWFLDDSAGWAPSDELVDFLGAGPPPVFVGFGSTPFPQPRAATETVVQALALAGMRAVLLAGGSGLATGRLTDDVLSIDSVPHGWLFPRVSAAVHHGGAGVTGAALRAGLPSVVVPVFGDQPFWGQRVFDLGAGPRPIPARQLTAEALAAAIRLTGNGEMRRRAAALGEQIRKEDGVGCAVGAVHQHLGVTASASLMLDSSPGAEDRRSNTTGR